MDAVPLAPGYTRTRPGTGSPKGTSTYSALLAQVKENGLLRRRTGFYWTLFASLAAGLALTWVAFAFLGDSWFQFIVAGALGVMFTQFAFLSHEDAHRQVFASQRWNAVAGPRPTFTGKGDPCATIVVQGSKKKVAWLSWR